MINLNKTINYIKSAAEIVIILLAYTLITTIFYYFEIINPNTLNILNYIITLILFIYLGYKTAKRNKEKGYLSGLIISLIISILFILISIITKDFKISSLIYYITLIASSIIGGIIGVSKTEKK